MKKCIGTQIELNQRTMLVDVKLVEMFDRRFGLAFRRSECTEIMFANQLTGCLLHVIYIKQIMTPAYRTAQQGWPYRTHQQNVSVAPGRGAESRMEVISDLLRPQNRNIIRQKTIDPSDPGGDGATDLRVKMYNLHGGIHASIRAARRHNPYRLTGDLGQCILQCILNGAATWL